MLNDNDGDDLPPYDGFRDRGFYISVSVAIALVAAAWAVIHYG